MKAVYVKEPGSLEVVEVEKPQIKKDTQVLVKITAAGICGSDIHILHGTHALSLIHISRCWSKCPGE